MLGDPATIVTETDSQHLKDMVTDLSPVIPEPAPTTETPTQNTDTTKKQEVITTAPVEKPTEAAAPQGKGLTVAFEPVTVFIPNIETKTYRNQDPKKGSGASYQLIDGNLNNNQLKISEGNVTKVSQRYQTVVILKNSLGTLQLDALSNTTEWKELKGNKNTYTISGLDARKLEYADADASDIRKAVERALRAHRIAKRKHAEWLNSVRHTRDANQAPLKVVLRSVIWKIEGKDAKGKVYQKQLRIDLP